MLFKEDGGRTCYPLGFYLGEVSEPDEPWLLGR